MDMDLDMGSAGAAAGVVVGEEAVAGAVDGVEVSAAGHGDGLIMAVTMVPTPVPIIPAITPIPGIMG